jgi:hypothetical protein
VLGPGQNYVPLGGPPGRELNVVLGPGQNYVPSGGPPGRELNAHLYT